MLRSWRSTRYAASKTASRTPSTLMRNTSPVSPIVSQVSTSPRVSDAQSQVDRLEADPESTTQLSPRPAGHRLEELAWLGHSVAAQAQQVLGVRLQRGDPGVKMLGHVDAVGRLRAPADVHVRHRPRG